MLDQITICVLVICTLFACPAATAAAAAVPVKAPTTCSSPWNPKQNYAPNSAVSYSGINYISKWWENSGWAPVATAGFKTDGGWKPVGPCDTAVTSTTTPSKTKAAPSTTTIRTPPISVTGITSTTPTPPSLPACFQKWSDKQPYPSNSQVSLNNTNYKSKWYQAIGKSPILSPTSDGGWELQTPCDPSKPVPPNNGPPPVPETLAEHRAYAASLSTDANLVSLKQSVRTSSMGIVDGIFPGNPANPDNVKRVERIVTPFKWNVTYFSMADPAYTYTNFLKSVGYFSGFCDTYPGKDSDMICKKLLATMFAHFAQETGAHDKKSSIPEWRQSLVYLREISCTENNTISGCYYNGDCTNPAFNTVFTCGKGPSNGFKTYFGRGAHQLSYSFNYGPFSELMFNGDPTILLNKPELQPPKPSMLWVMDGTYVPNAADLAAGRINDFPSTIQIINGECAGSSTSNAAQNRINYYTAFMKDMGLDTSASVLKCAGMPSFDSSSAAGKTEMYWVADYSGKPVCQLVSYQTNFNALMDGVGYDQYVKCVETSFKLKLGF